MPIIQFEYSLWLLPLYLLGALGLSYLLYSKIGPWSQKTNYFLFTLRTLLLTALAILLLNPLINQFLEQIEKPQVVLALDNSSSMTNGADSLQLKQLVSELSTIKDQMNGSGYEASIIGLDGKTLEGSDILFDQKTTDLSTLLREIDAQYENTNLASVFLISDGRFNQGSSPIYQNHAFQINSIGIGDTIQKVDLELRSVRYNKVAYQGNRFPIIAEVYNYGFKGQSSNIEVKSKGKTIDSKIIRFTKDEGIERVEFEIEANEKGLQPFQVSIKTLEGEITQANNQRTIYIDVIDGKQKIALIAPAPHPDAKALKTVIEKNKNFEVHLHLPGQKPLPSEKFDLAIIHQAFDRYNRTKNIVDKLKAEGVPMFFILGSQSRLNALTPYISGVQILQKRNQKDQVVGQINPQFNLFTLDQSTNERWSEFIPISVPYGDMQIPSNASVLLSQRIGSVTTDKPLLFAVEQDQQKKALLLGDGIWQWRMQEYALHENTETFDDLFLKLIQYLSTKVDKRKFRLYPTENEFVSSQDVTFQAELYNDIYERIFGQEISVNIWSDEMEKREFSFIPSSQYSELEVSRLNAGTYQYEASTTIGNKKHSAKGSFVIKEEQLEQLDQVADFGLLRELAENNQGSFYSFDNLDQLNKDMDGFDYKSKIHYEEQTFPAINLLWAMLIIMLFASTEWFTRKYSGGY